jgi:acyl carrier protein
VTRADILTKLRSFITTELMAEPDYPLADDEPLVSGGLIDSFALAHVATFIEEAFGRYIPDTELDPNDFDTLERIAARVEAARPLTRRKA